MNNVWRRTKAMDFPDSRHNAIGELCDANAINDTKFFFRKDLVHSIDGPTKTGDQSNFKTQVQEPNSVKFDPNLNRLNEFNKISLQFYGNSS